VRIAIGGNRSQGLRLDLMRLNKSFIVRRSAKGRGRCSPPTRTLHIRHSGRGGSSIWIAQRRAREGRLGPHGARDHQDARHRQGARTPVRRARARAEPRAVAISYGGILRCGQARELYLHARRRLRERGHGTSRASRTASPRTREPCT
jgi:hypothetical protein